MSAHEWTGFLTRGREGKMRENCTRVRCVQSTTGLWAWEGLPWYSPNLFIRLDIS